MTEKKSLVQLRDSTYSIEVVRSQEGAKGLTQEIFFSNDILVKKIDYYHIGYASTNKGLFTFCTTPYPVIEVERNEEITSREVDPYVLLRGLAEIQSFEIPNPDSSDPEKMQEVPYMLLPDLDNDKGKDLILFLQAAEAKNFYPWNGLSDEQPAHLLRQIAKYLEDIHVGPLYLDMQDESDPVIRGTSAWLRNKMATFSRRIKKKWMGIPDIEEGKLTLEDISVYANRMMGAYYSDNLDATGVDVQKQTSCPDGRVEIDDSKKQRKDFILETVSDILIIPEEPEQPYIPREAQEERVLSAALDGDSFNLSFVNPRP